VNLDQKGLVGKHLVGQKISWPSMPGKGPTGDLEDVTTKSPEEFSRINGHSESG
jgi:hypothetical protein